MIKNKRNTKINQYFALYFPTIIKSFLELNLLMIFSHQKKYKNIPREFSVFKIDGHFVLPLKNISS